MNTQTVPAVPAGFQARPQEPHELEDDVIFDGPAQGLVTTFWATDTGVQVSIGKVPEEMSPADAQALIHDLGAVLEALDG